MTDKPCVEETASVVDGTVSTDFTGPKDVVTKDRWEIILLIAKGFGFSKVDRIIKDNGKKMSVFHFGPEAYQLWHDFKYGVPIAVDNVRTLVEAETIFKGFID